MSIILDFVHRLQADGLSIISLVTSYSRYEGTHKDALTPPINSLYYDLTKLRGDSCILVESDSIKELIRVNLGEETRGPP